MTAPWWAECELCGPVGGPYPNQDTAADAAGGHDDTQHHALPTATVRSEAPAWLARMGGAR
jgi:hypothetical protein